MPGKLCECGCGKPVGVYKQTESRYGVRKGDFRRFCVGHAIRVHGTRVRADSAITRDQHGSNNPGWRGENAAVQSGRCRALRTYTVLGKCQKCRTAKAYDRHHVDGNTLNNSPENVMQLCRKCHMIVDGRYDKYSLKRSPHCAKIV